MRRMTRKAARRRLRSPYPSISFAVDAEHGFPWRVLVFRTAQQMRRYLAISRPDKRHGSDLAFTDERSMEIVFALSTCTDNNVAHEMHHAATYWASWIGLRPDLMARWGHPTHERVAEAHGNLVEQFWKAFTAAGFSRERCAGFRGSPGEQRKTSRSD